MEYLVWGETCFLYILIFQYSLSSYWHCFGRLWKLQNIEEIDLLWVGLKSVSFSVLSFLLNLHICEQAATFLNYHVYIMPFLLP